MPVQVGTDVDRLIPELTPGGQSIAGKGRGRANRGSGSKTIVVPSNALGRRTIVLTAQMPVGVVSNIAGASVTTTSLTTINPAFTPTAPLFPGADADDNDIQWLLAVPLDMANVPNLSIRLHIISK